MAFVLDNSGHNSLIKDNTDPLLQLREPKDDSDDESGEEIQYEEEDEEEDSYDADKYGLPPPDVDLSEIIESALQLTVRRKTKEELELERVHELVNIAAANAKPLPGHKNPRLIDLDFSDFNELTGKFDEEQLFKPDVNKVLAKSTIGTDFEQLKATPSLTPKQFKKMKKIERSQTKGADWYNLPATELTESVQNDLKILQMRSVLDPKHFYKKNDLKVLPKYFQIGTVQHSPLEYYNERGTRKNKRKTMVDELLEDDAVQQYAKKKYNETVARKEKYAHRKAQNKMKKLKKNK